MTFLLERRPGGYRVVREDGEVVEFHVAPRHARVEEWLRIKYGIRGGRMRSRDPIYKVAALRRRLAELDLSDVDWEYVKKCEEQRRATYRTRETLSPEPQRVPIPINEDRS